MTVFIDYSQDKIIKLTEHLKTTYNLNISFHLSDEYSFYNEKHIQKLEIYNIHDDPYCFYIKNIKSQYKSCITCQTKIFNRCLNESSFIDYCHANVCQYIHRVIANNIVVGFICVSEKNNYLELNFTTKNLTPPRSFKKVSAELLEIIIPPLALMLSSLYSDYFKATPLTAFQRIIKYIDEHHNSSLNQISKDLGYSNSYISHIFCQETGITLKSYCNSLKIQDAKNLLLQTNLSITDVALICGFNSISYFITTFKKETSMSPARWKKQNQPSRFN